MISFTEDEKCIFLEIGSGHTLINMGGVGHWTRRSSLVSLTKSQKDNFEALEKVALTLCDNSIFLNMEKFYSGIGLIKTHRR